MSDDQDRPNLTVVAENTEQQIDSNLLQEKIDYALRVLAANVIRVVRGAGKPDDIIYQCNDVVKAAVEYKEKAGRFVSSHAVAGALRLARERIDDYDSFHGQRQLAMREMMNGSLQVVASRLLGQLTQEHRGERDMFEAFRELERIYQELRKQREAEAKAARTRATSKHKTVKRKPKKAKVPTL